MSLAIDVADLNKSFGDKHVVQDLSIQVAEGRICGFLGPNGSGKTTTLRMLCPLGAGSHRRPLFLEPGPHLLTTPVSIPPRRLVPLVLRRERARAIRRAA